MNRHNWSILLIDDDRDDYYLTKKMLAEAQEGKFQLQWASSYEKGQAALEKESFDAVIVDYDLGCRTGIDLVRQAVMQGYPAPILLLTGRGTYEVDMQAMEAGAADFLCKGEVNAALLERAIRYAIERKKHEQALKESEGRYRTLFTSMLNGFGLHEVICNASGEPIDYRFLEVNPAFEQMTGLKEKDIIGKTVLEILPGIEPFWIETYGKVALTGIPIQFEKYSPLLEKHYQVYSFSPRKNQFATLFADITDHKRAEEKLHESEMDLARAQAVSQTGSWRLDIKRNALMWSDETYHIFEIPLGSPLTYESFLEMVHPEDRDQVDRAWNAAMQGETYDIEHRILAGDKVKWVRERAELEFDEQGSLKSGFGAVQDITKLKQVENDLREAQERFRIALANPSIGVFSTDLDLRYTWFVSSAMGAITDSFIGKRDDELLPPENAAELMDLKQRAINQRSAVREEINILVGEKQRSVILSVEPQFDSQGNIIGVVGACFDVTEQRRLEAESFDHLTQMEVHHRLLEQREKERQQIARDLHDGPIQVMVGLLFNLQVMKDDVQDPALREAFVQNIGTLKQAINELRYVINELRPPALIRFGITKALRFYSEEYNEKHPELEFDLNLQTPEDESCLSEHVSLTIYRIFQEALANISRHSGATQVKVRFKQIRDYVILEIQDNGKGFKVFPGLLEQAQNNHFGLVGMRERAETVGGHFTLSSEPGKGTTIYVTLPLVVA